MIWEKQKNKFHYSWHKHMQKFIESEECDEIFAYLKQRKEEINIPDLCASFQETVTEVLVNKSIKAIDEFDAKMFIIAGGVAANKGLRTKINERITHVKVVVPEFRYCTDNAAMIGVAGYYQYQKQQQTDDMTLNGSSRLKMEA